MYTSERAFKILDAQISAIEEAKSAATEKPAKKEKAMKHIKKIPLEKLLVSCGLPSDTPINPTSTENLLAVLGFLVENVECEFQDYDSQDALYVFFNDGKYTLEDGDGEPLEPSDVVQFQHYVFDNNLTICLQFDKDSKEDFGIPDVLYLELLKNDVAWARGNTPSGKSRKAKESKPKEEAPPKPDPELLQPVVVKEDVGIEQVDSVLSVLGF